MKKVCQLVIEKIAIENGHSISTLGDFLYGGYTCVAESETFSRYASISLQLVVVGSCALETEVFMHYLVDIFFHFLLDCRLLI